MPAVAPKWALGRQGTLSLCHRFITEAIPARLWPETFPPDRRTCLLRTTFVRLATHPILEATSGGPQEHRHIQDS